MADTWHRMRWQETMWSILIALALVLMPLSSLRAGTCDDHADQARRPVAAENAAPHQSGDMPRDHQATPGKVCCNTVCNTPVLALTDTGAPPYATVAGSLFSLHDQAGDGLTLPPTLGPPRLPA